MAAAPQPWQPTAVRVHEAPISSAESLASAVADFGPLYAILDAARDRAIVEHVSRDADVFESLYGGRRARQLAAVAPYLALLSPRGPLLETIARDGWGKSWGVLLAAHAPFAEVRRHLRTFLTVELDEGQACAFRFYDPRVLCPYLESATEDEARAFFGPAHALFVEGRAPGTFPGAPRSCASLLRFERVGPAAPRREVPWALPRIRAEVCARFAEQLGRAFVERNAARLADALRPWAPELEATKRLVQLEVAHAERHGVEGAADLERYLDLLAVLGRGFDERLPWAGGILARDDLTSSQKVARLERHVRREGALRRA
jgi:hypothetical protein